MECHPEENCLLSTPKKVQKDAPRVKETSPDDQLADLHPQRAASPEEKAQSSEIQKVELEILNEFEELHNATMYIEQDSMLVSQTEFIDMNLEPQFKMKAPVLDSILEEKFFEKERIKSNMKVHETLSSFTYVTEKADLESNNVS